MPNPCAAILVIGAEVLSGKVRDVNGPFLIDGLRRRGLSVLELRAIGDDEALIAEAVIELSRRADWVLTTGGIGPTHDDVTVAGVARAFGRAIVRDAGLVRIISQRYGDATTEEHLRMADVPEGSRIHHSPAAVAVIQTENVFLLPGVPVFMQRCFENLCHLLPQAAWHSDEVRLNVSEPAIAGHLRRVQAQYPGVAIGSYPRFDAAPYRVKVTVDGRDPERVKAAMAAIRSGLPEGAVVPSASGEGDV